MAELEDKLPVRSLVRTGFSLLASDCAHPELFLLLHSPACPDLLSLFTGNAHVDLGLPAVGVTTPDPSLSLHGAS